nr:hypothetical protein [Mucilaginibacter sp. X5P1]
MIFYDALNYFRKSNLTIMIYRFLFLDIYDFTKKLAINF